MMAQNRLQCYVCGHAFGRQQMARIDGEENAHKREIAITRRDALGQNPLDITDRTRLCLNCNRLIIAEITALERDPYCFKLNVLRQTQNRTCLFCNAAVNLHRLSIACRVDVFVKRNIYISEITKSCTQHLDDRGFILPLLLPALQFVNRPYSIRGDQMQLFLDELRNAVNNTRVYQNENDFEDDAFQCISPITKEQFQDLFTYCVPVHSAGHNRNITKKDLMTFLCKLRQGLSDDFLKVIFHYKSRQNVSLVVATVRISLMQRFVPSNIGFAAITREDYIARHCTDFSNELYNPQPENRKALAYIDGSYLRIQKSSNFRTLRQSYSVHKGYHLLKPALVVAPDGYILTIHGPYFSDASNNDAQMLQNEFEQDMQGMREWFQNGDIFIVDRGYRDAIPLLEAMGITHRMPCLLERGQRQFTTEQANESRIVTKTRWVVEARNGHLKSIFKFFANVIQITHTKNLGDFLRIAGAIINKYHPPIRMEEANAELARELLQKSRQVNVVQERVDAENLRVLRANWNRLNHQHVRNFPLLTLDYLRELTVGTYQVNLAPSYVQDKLQRDGQEEFQIDVHFDKPSLIRVRVYSRYRNATKHQLWISYNEMEDDNIDNDNDDVEPITGYYCTCQAGARTLGTCAHVASVLWFLGYARHQQRIKYPSTQPLQSVQDAAHRLHQQDPNHGIE